MTDGQTICAIGERNGMVVMSFPKPIQEFIIGPEQARQMAEQFAKSAYTAHHGHAPDGAPRSIVTDQLRNRLRARSALVVRSLFEQGKSAEYIGQHITDLLLSEVA
jgi:hypothetical protein